MQFTIAIESPPCHSRSIEKNGKKSNGVRNYRCKDCGRQFIQAGEKKYNGCHVWIADTVKALLERGVGIRDAGAILKISIKKVLSVLESTDYQIKPQQEHYDVLETDEFCIYVGKKAKKVWLIYAYHRGSGEIVAYQ